MLYELQAQTDEDNTENIQKHRIMCWSQRGALFFYQHLDLQQKLLYFGHPIYWREKSHYTS